MKRFLIMAAILAVIFCLFPLRVHAPEKKVTTAQHEGELTQPAGADLSERTAAGCFLHKTLFYAPCGHSVQRREDLPAQLVGMTRSALEKEIADVLPGATVTGFSSAEVDASVKVDIPCPLHWVLRADEDGTLIVLQNRSGENLSIVRRTDIPLTHAAEAEQADLINGRIFDNVQALEGYLESLVS